MDISIETQFIYMPIWGKYSYPDLLSKSLNLVEILPLILIHFIRLLSLLTSAKMSLLSPACGLRATSCRTHDSVWLISCSGAGQSICKDQLPCRLPSLSLPLLSLDYSLYIIRSEMSVGWYNVRVRGQALQILLPQHVKIFQPAQL
jgi:hypothetical protein